MKCVKVLPSFIIHVCAWFSFSSHYIWWLCVCRMYSSVSHGRHVINCQVARATVGPEVIPGSSHAKIKLMIYYTFRKCEHDIHPFCQAHDVALWDNIWTKLKLLQLNAWHDLIFMPPKNWISARLGPTICRAAVCVCLHPVSGSGCVPSPHVGCDPTCGCGRWVLCGSWWCAPPVPWGSFWPGDVALRAHPQTGDLGVRETGMREEMEKVGYGKSKKVVKRGKETWQILTPFTAV